MLRNKEKGFHNDFIEYGKQDGSANNEFAIETDIYSEQLSRAAMVRVLFSFQFIKMKQNLLILIRQKFTKRGMTHKLHSKEKVNKSKYYVSQILLMNANTRTDH